MRGAEDNDLKVRGQGLFVIMATKYQVFLVICGYYG